MNNRALSIRVSGILIALLTALYWPAGAAERTLISEDEDPIEIVETDDRTIYEYRQNGVLIMIKVVPRNGLGRPYYMVPADGSPHFKSLDHEEKLYPQWVIVEW